MNENKVVAAVVVVVGIVLVLLAWGIWDACQSLTFC